MDILKGIARHYGQRDMNGHLIRAGAFDESLAAFAAGKVPIPLLDAHNMHHCRAVIGSVKGIKDSSRRMLFEAQLADTPAAEAVSALYKDGHLDGVSIGYRIHEYTFVDEGVDVIEAELVEVSVVPLPAQKTARLTGLQRM